jgi:trehalose 6-phosphate synthase
MARVVIVSNRLPLPVARAPSAGGLAIALKEAVAPGGLWFGWSGRRTAETSTDALIATHKGVDYATIDLSQDDYRKFYVGYANGTLWPLLHFHLGFIEFRREHLDGYRAVNEAFARALAKLLRPDDLVWVHDYHLIPLAAALRKLGVTCRTGFFLHIPFVPSSVFNALPRGEELLEDFCAYDVVGFQTEEHHRDFLDSVRRILGYPVNANAVIAAPGRLVHSIVAPVGIDAEAFRVQAERSAKGKYARRMIDSLAGRHLMIGADRLDYTKGLPNRFEAFNRFLTRFSEHSQRVSFLQVAAPSREDVAEYAALRTQLNRMSGDINGRHGTFDWVPLRYMSQGMARSTLAGFFRQARVGVVTPLRDGMNLVACEYVAAQDTDNPGVLILSRFAGIASHFESALIVNPYDPDEIAEAMNEALNMPLEERRWRHQSQSANLGVLTSASFCSTFLTALGGGGPPARHDRGVRHEAH